MLDFLKSLWDSFANLLLSVLPTSPFTEWLDKLGNLPYLGWLNYFVPFNDFITIGTAFLGAVALFYVYQIVMRWLKVIGD